MSGEHVNRGGSTALQVGFTPQLGNESLGHVWTVTVCFTPSGNYADIIVKALSGAKPTILVQAFSFTSAPIAKP